MAGNFGGNITCGPGDGSGDQPGIDTELVILCDKMPDGTIAGTAIAVRPYDDQTGIPTGPPTFVIPGTNDPYVVQGMLEPCSECNLTEPQTFYFTSSSTGPADFPGRSYDGTLNISRGYSVDQLSIGGVNYPVALTWSILDTEGTEFAEALRAAIQSRIPGSTVTVTPPPIDRCDTSNRPFQIQIDCIDADRAPTDVTIRYDSGTDLVTNPAQLNEDGEPAVAPGGLGFQLRQDDDGTYQPQAPHTLDCTSVDTEGWYLTPQARFETWGAGFLNTTPTPRGGSIIELNTTTGTPEWLHQKVTVPADGTYTLRAFLGGRVSDVTWNLRLSTGDTGAAGGGDIANITQVTPPVGETPNPQPWSRLEQTSINLVAGTYTLSMTGTGGGGALYTDLQLFTTSAGTVTSLVADDECINTREVTTNTVVCEQWLPLTDGNCDIVSWRRLDTGEIMTNDDFFAQVPAPVGCYIAPEGEDPEVTFGNLVTTYEVCGSNDQSYQRTVITDNSGASISELWTTSDGVNAPPPLNYTIGACPTGDPDIEVMEVCINGTTAFREVVYNNGSELSVRFLGNDGVQIVDPAAWSPGACPAGADLEELLVCATVEVAPGFAIPTQVIRRVLRSADGTDTITYIAGDQGDVTAQVQSWTPGECEDPERLVLCDANGDSFIQRHEAPNATLNQGTGIRYFDLEGNPLFPAPPTPYSVCQPSGIDVEVETLCDHGNLRPFPGEPTSFGPKPFLRTYVFNSDGTLANTRDTELDGQTAYAPTGPVFDCDLYDTEFDSFRICLDGESLTMVRAIVYFETLPIANSTLVYNPLTYETVQTPNVGEFTYGPCETEQRVTMWPRITCVTIAGVRSQAWQNEDGTFTGTDGNLVTPDSWTPGVCPPETIPLDTEEIILCDENGAFRRRTVFNGDGTVASQNDFTIDGAAYTVGTIEPCSVTPADSELAEIVVCADGATAIRRITSLNGAITAETFIGANGATIVPAAWEPGPCTAPDTVDNLVCASVAGELQQAFRRVDQTGNVTFIGLNGTVIAPQSWRPGPCDPTRGDIDIELLTLCDFGTLTGPNGGPQPFVRKIQFDVNTGNRIATTDHELNSSAAYSTVGPVGECGPTVAAPTNDAHVQTVTATTTVAPTGQLISWSVRARTPGIQIDLGDGPVTMDVGETIAAEAEHDGILNDPPTIIVAPGASARLVWVERV